MPTPKEIEFYVDEEQFLTFARAIKKGFRASELGWVEMEVKDGKMTLSTAKAGSVLACIGRGTVIGRVAMGNLAKLATAHKKPKGKTKPLRLAFRPEFGEMATEFAGVKAHFDYVE